MWKALEIQGLGKRAARLGLLPDSRQSGPIGKRMVNLRLRMCSHQAEVAIIMLNPVRFASACLACLHAPEFGSGARC